MKQSGVGAEDKSPEKEPPKKKERSGGSIKKRLSIGYGFSTLRKRNPIKGVFEEDDRKKGKSIEIKVDDLGWKQTKHVGQEEAQQLKALMVLTKQLGEEDTDEIAQLLEEWDAGKVQKEIEDRKRMQMQKNRSLQVVMEQWGRGTVRDAPPGPVDSDSALPSITSSTSSSTSGSSTHPGLLRTGTSTPPHADSAGFAAIPLTASPVTSSTLSPVTSATLSPVASSDRVAAVPNNNNDSTADRYQIKDEPKATLDAPKTSANDHGKLFEYDRGRRRSSFDDSSTWSMDDEYTADSSIIIEDDDEDLMEVPEIGSEGNESEGSEGGGRSPRSSLVPDKKKKKLREPRHVPPSMVFGKKENLDLRDWQTFLDAERARAIPYVNSPRRTSSPRNSPRNSPAGFLIFKQKKMLTLNGSPASHTGSKLGSGGHSARGRSGSGSGGDVSGGGGDGSGGDGGSYRRKKDDNGRRSWSDDESCSYVRSSIEGGGGDEVVELAEMSEGEETEGEGSVCQRTHRDSISSTTARVPSIPLPTKDPAVTPSSTTTTPKTNSPTIPKIVLNPQTQERTVKLMAPPAQSPTSPQRGAMRGSADGGGGGGGGGGASMSPARSRKEQIRRISLSDSQLVFFQRWMRDTVKDGKVEVPAEVEQEIREREREGVRRYEKMDADALRKALVKRDKETAVLRRVVEDLKRREEKAVARERELREEVKRERERADRVQQRENVLKEMIREKVEEKRKMKEERDKELLRRSEDSSDHHRDKRKEKHNNKDKCKDKDKGKSEKKRKGSAIKFVSKDKGDKEREKAERERSRAGRGLEKGGSSGGLEAQIERMESGVGHGLSGSATVGRATGDELTSLQELVKGGTWSKSRGREVKIFKHLRSKSSEEVPTAFVAKESRDAH